MTSRPERMTDDELVTAWEKLTLASGVGDMIGRNYERLSPQADALAKELKRRGPASHAKLLPFLSHAAAIVRMSAAIRCYDIAPEACRSALERIVREEPKQSGPHFHAWFSLFMREKEGRL